MKANCTDHHISPAGLEGSRFARQFVAGPKGHLRTPETWSTTTLGAFQIATHPALNIAYATSNECSVALLGIALDALDSERDLGKIAETLAEAASHSVERLIESTAVLGGRWLVLATTRNGTVAFSDPCAQRQIRYMQTAEGTWLGSTVAVIQTQTGLAHGNSPLLNEFMKVDSQRKNEFAWVGPETPYKNCFTLLPNHYLNIDHVEVRRFFPSNPIPHKTRSEAVKLAALMLTNLMRSAARRPEGIMIPVTAGWDSRVLLAASKSIAHSDRVMYYIDRMGELSDYHPDIRIPRALSRRLNFKLEVLDSREEPTPQFKKVLGDNLGFYRELPKTRMIYSKFIRKEGRLNINGNCSEICRNYYHSHISLSGMAISAKELARMLGYVNVQYVEQCLSSWLNSLSSENSPPQIDILDLLYWEQRMGLWGAQYPAEQDVAIDEISPFNCRALICTLLGSPASDRMAPRYPLYEELIREMWPETMEEPINPLEYSVGGLKRALKSLYLRYLKQPRVRPTGIQ